MRQHCVSDGLGAITISLGSHLLGFALLVFDLGSGNVLSLLIADVMRGLLVELFIV